MFSCEHFFSVLNRVSLSLFRIANLFIDKLRISALYADNRSTWKTVNVEHFFERTERSVGEVFFNFRVLASISTALALINWQRSFSSVADKFDKQIFISLWMGLQQRERGSSNFPLLNQFQFCLCVYVCLYVGKENINWNKTRLKQSLALLPHFRCQKKKANPGSSSLTLSTRVFLLIYLS